MKTFYLIYTYPGQEALHIAHGTDDKVIIAQDENLLVSMGDGLLKMNLIANYKIVQEVFAG